MRQQSRPTSAVVHFLPALTGLGPDARDETLRELGAWRRAELWLERDDIARHSRTSFEDGRQVRDDSVVRRR